MDQPDISQGGAAAAGWQQIIGLVRWIGSRPWRGQAASFPKPDGITEISRQSLYILRAPKAALEVEIVFIHGLQLYDYKDAYWKTWMSGEKGKEVLWPQQWLAEDLPGARIWSLSYDASAFKSSTAGRMDMYILGESLAQHLVNFGKIGQGNCPVVFVCHSLGGLVVKEIVRQAHTKFGSISEYQTFLKNVSAFHFYSTPHNGSKLADLFAHMPLMGETVRILEVINNQLGRLNSEFKNIGKNHYDEKWKFAVVAEKNKTPTLAGHSVMVVDEASARHEYISCLMVNEDHYGVCRPESKTSASYLYLVKLIQDSMAVQKRTLTVVTDEDRQEMINIM